MRIIVATFLACLLLPGAEPPTAEIGNGQIKAKLYLPDAVNGFYRSTRFDWSGVVASLKYKGHNFYGPWFYRVDPGVYDLGYDQKGVISAPFTAMVGPAEEFGTDGAALGFAEAEPGGTFIKIGVGVLRKPRAGEPAVPARPPAQGGASVPVAPDRYDHSRTYTLVDSGKWTVKKKRDSVEFTQELHDPADGYAYIYRKVIRLVPAKPQMVIEHSLKNIGQKTIRSTVYNHNFFVLDGEGPSRNLTITVPFPIVSPRPPTAGLLEVQGNQLTYLKTLANEDRATAAIQGFGDTAKDYDIRVENKKSGAGVRIQGDQPITRIVYWSIRTTLCPEAYITMEVPPGKQSKWTYTYTFYDTRGK